MKLSFPSELSIFPLSGALLLPNARLPLMAFEPRYVTMVEDALACGRLLGMLQPREGGEKLYDVGCLGRIVRFEELEDSRRFIVLKGVRRFRTLAESPLAQGGYRRCKIDGSEFLLDENPPRSEAGLPRERLQKAIEDSARDILPADFDLNALLACGDEEIINLLSILCPFSTHEKQALLEAENVVERGKALLALLEMEAFSASKAKH